MQLVLSFMETDELETQLTAIWQRLDEQQRAEVVTMLARLMLRAVETVEDDDE